MNFQQEFQRRQKEEENEENQEEMPNFFNKKVLFVCRPSGKVIAGFGNQKEIGFKPVHLIGKNFFSAGFLKQTLDQMKKRHPHGLLNNLINRTLDIQLINKKNMLLVNQKKFNTLKTKLIYPVVINCSKAVLQLGRAPMKVEKIEIKDLKRKDFHDVKNKKRFIKIVIVEMTRIKRSILTKYQDYIKQVNQIRQNEENQMSIQNECNYGKSENQQKKKNIQGFTVWKKHPIQKSYKKNIR